jgi:hypothetical protein
MAQDIVAKIQAAAQARGIDPDVALRIADVESNLRPGAKNPNSSAAGLFQVTDDTWKQYGGKKGMKKNADENIRVGMQILSSNKASLEQVLGREPTGSELYAAHFFGPTGARKVLSADPLTPVSALVSKQAMAANPQLEGKTVNEVMAGFRQKFDEGGKRYPTSEPVKTTVVAQAPRTMDQGMEGKAGAAAPALSARDRVADLGANYQAALAAMMLGEATDEEKEDAAEKVTPYESEAAKNALTGMDLGQTVSPFSAMEPAVQPEGMPFPMRFAEGGLALPVGEAFTIKTAQDLQAKPYYDLEEMAKQDDSIWSKLPSEVFGIPISQDAYKQAALSGLGYAVGLGPLMNKVNQATGLVKTGLNIYDIATDQYLPNNPEVYQINNANIPARESGMPAPVISSMSQPPAPVVNLSTPYVPASGSQFWQGTPVAPTPAPVVSSGDSSPAPGPFSTTSSDSGSNSGGGSTWSYDASDYGSVSDYFADGGEVKEFPGIMDVQDYATQASERMFPNEAGQDDRRDAARHMLAAALASKAVGPTAADLLGKAHERFSSPESFFNMFGVGEPRYDYEYDTHNNRIGIKLGEQATSRDELEALVKQMAEQASIRRNPNLPWAMDQEQRDAVVEEQNRRMQPKPYGNGGEADILDLDKEEARAFASKNVTKTKNPDNPDQEIPNAPRGRAGKELIEFLRQAQAVPVLQQSPGTPRAYKNPAYFSDDETPQDPGYIRFPTFAQDPYNSLVHELTHAADRPMRLEHKRLLGKIANQEPLTADEQRYFDNYQKLYIEPTKLPLKITEPQATRTMREYRTGADELRAFGAANMAQNAPHPDMYSRVDIGATLNPHVDPTMAQEAAIMRDLYLRSGAVRGRAEGSPPEGEYADPEAAALAGLENLPPARVTDAQAALALMRGAGDLPYVLAGAPVDISNLIMSPFGKRTEEFSSDWFKKGATEAGIRPPDETDPTLAGLRLMGEFGASAINPSSVPRAVAQGVQKTGQAARMLEDMTIGNMQRAKIRGAAEQVPDDAAYAPLRERMEAQGNLALAVKPVGGYFVAGDGTGTFANEMDMFVKLGIGDSEIPAVQSFVDKQMKDYLSKTMGSPKDPLRQAIDEGRVPYLRRTDDEGAGIDNFKVPSMAALRAKRKYQGFPEEGYAQTEGGEEFENYIDWMIDPYAPSTMEIRELPPALRKKAEAAIKERGIEDADYTDAMGNIFGSDYAAPGAKTAETLGLGATESLYSFFDKYRVLNLQATKGMLEKMLTDTTLPDVYRLTPDQLSQMSLADASVAAKKLDNYLIKLADKQRLNRINEMPTTKIYETGERWLAPDDLAVEHDQRALVRVLGEKGGWCTKEDCNINMYGSAENRLNILVDKTGRPQVQVTTTIPEDVDAKSWFLTLDQAGYDAAQDTIKRYFQNNNLPVPSVATIDNTIGLDRIFANDPQYQAFVRENSQPVAFAVERATKVQGESKTELTEEAFNKTIDLVRTRGARFDRNDRTIRNLRAVAEPELTGAFTTSGEPLLRDIGGQINGSVTNAAESLFKDTVLSAPELVRVLRDPQVRQSLPLNILNKADNLFNRFADAPPEAFKYAMDARDYDPDFAERVIPIIDAKKYHRWKDSMDPLYQRAMREWNFAKGGLVERSVYNHQKYL